MIFFCLLSCSRSRHKENTTLKAIYAYSNGFGDEGRAAPREAKEVWAFAPGVLLSFLSVEFKRCVVASAGRREPSVEFTLS